MSQTVRDGKTAKWPGQIVRWMDGCHAKMPEPVFLRGELPEWVKRLARELMSTLWPTVKFQVEQTWTAGEVGATLGHQLAYLHGATQHCPRFKTSTKIFKYVDKKLVKRMENKVDAFLKAFQIVLGRSLVLASAQSHDESVRFFGAFAKGLKKMPADMEASNFHRTTTKVYWLMLWGWRSVEKIENVRQLQQGLCRYLDPYVVGDVKRVEKICQRLGLHFGPPGRPRKARIQTR